MSKIFVLDTNVLLYDPQALFRFEENNVIIPITVIEEIERFKKDENETGRNAREVSRFIDDFRRVGLLSEGVPLDNGGNLRIKMYEEDLMKRLPPELRENRGDNRILAVAVDLKETENVPVILVSKDTSLRLKADVVGLVAHDYEFDEIVAKYITKSIEFDEDAYQAGVSILGYFSTVVKQKYPNTKVKVKIEQEGTTVRLIIDTPEGDRELIEKTLEDYGLVVVGEMQPAELLSDKIHEMQLRHKLDLAVIEVSYTKQLLAFAQESHKNEILHITEEVNLLKEQIRAAFKREDNAKDIIFKIIDNHSIQGEVKDAILKLSDLIGQNVEVKDKEVVLELISIIKSKNGPAFEDIKAYLISSFGGASGNLLSSWLPMLLAAIAK
ncbi:PIN domain-containing protein [Geobacter grbiciae]|uniref:PIN domain-containing protein n=1 Tax=Geobacter grbiciae TaxID=155042 RepID=UPI001C01B399|nr:PIN domain-containing protein [Geobacter grbiciae]MBT1077306.1 hypothetical protein [Geobacter grbiciae]